MTYSNGIFIAFYQRSDGRFEVHNRNSVEQVTAEIEDREEMGDRYLGAIGEVNVELLHAAFDFVKTLDPKNPPSRIELSDIVAFIKKQDSGSSPKQ